MLSKNKQTKRFVKTLVISVPYFTEIKETLSYNTGLYNSYQLPLACG
jgi:hypothetical protein